MACTLSSLYIPATASTCSIPRASSNGAFVPSGNRLKSKVSSSDSFNQRRSKAVVGRNDSLEATGTVLSRGACVASARNIYSQASQPQASGTDVVDKSRSLGAKNVVEIAADVTKEEDYKRFIDETINLYGFSKIPF